MLLEIKKFKLTGYVIGSIIATIGVFLMVYAIALEEGGGSFNEPIIFEISKIFANGVFLIFGAVMLAKYIISEYEDQTITVLFTYPIKRTKVILAKIIVVSVFIIIVNLAANFTIIGLFYLLSTFKGQEAIVITQSFLFDSFVRIGINALAFSLMNSVSLFVGLIKKSTVATIVTSVILVSVVGSSSNGASLSNFLIIPVTVGIIGVIALYSLLRNVESADIT